METTNTGRRGFTDGEDSPSEALGGAASFSAIMGPPLDAHVPRHGHGAVVCTWNHPELHEYEIPETADLVVALQTSGPPARTRVGRRWSDAAPAHTLHVVPPGLPTRWKVDGSLGFLSVHVSVDRVRTLLGSDAGAAQLQRVPFRFAVRDHLLEAASRELARELRRPGQTGGLYADVLADGIALRTLRLGDEPGLEAFGRGSLSERQLRIARERIEASLEHGISLSDLASAVGLSRFHFSRAFKVSTGLPPHRYLTERRIERAKELLLDEEKTISEVALEVGFNSQSHFTGSFRAATGTTPLRYRRGRR